MAKRSKSPSEINFSWGLDIIQPMDNTGLQNVANAPFTCVYRYNMLFPKKKFKKRKPTDDRSASNHSSLKMDWISSETVTNYSSPFIKQSSRHRLAYHHNCIDDISLISIWHTHIRQCPVSAKLWTYIYVYVCVHLLVKTISFTKLFIKSYASWKWYQLDWTTLNNCQEKWFVDNKQKKKKKNTHSHKITQYLSSYEWTQDGIRQWTTHLPEIINQLMSMANVLTDKWHRCTNHYDTFYVRFHWAIMGTNQNVLNIETVEHYHPNCHSEMFINSLFSY